MQPDREKSTLSDYGGARDLAMARLERAKEELASAQFNYENKQYFVANNRAYYAIYRAMCACLALEFKAFKKHGQTIGAFNKDFIHTGLFPAELGKKIARAQEVRHASDYDDFYILSIQDTEEQLATANELVSLVEKYLTSLPQDN